MTTLKKSLAMAIFASLLAGGLAAVPQAAFAQAKNPCAPKAANPCAPKAANPCAPKAMSADSKESGKSDMNKDKSSKSRGKFDYPLFTDSMLSRN